MDFNKYIMTYIFASHRITVSLPKSPLYSTYTSFTPSELLETTDIFTASIISPVP